MGKLNFYVLWSLRDVPRLFSSRSNRNRFQVHVPLPLPNQLVIFGLGEWESCDSSISVEVLVSADLPTQKIGTLSSVVRCLTWEDNWDSDMVTVAAQKGRKGVYGKILLTVCGEANTSIISSTSSVQRTSSFLEQNNVTELSSTLLQSVEHEMTTSNLSKLGVDIDADVQVNKFDTSDVPINELPVWPMVKTPRRTVISKRGHLTWSSEDMDSLSEDLDQASTPKKQKLSRLDSQERMVAQIKNESREVCPTKRWSHSMCLSDTDTAVLIGGETSEQKYCHDSLWKLELDNNFWFPLNSSAASEPVPLCAPGHTATFDPDSKEIYVYGGLRDDHDPSELHILNTQTWKWKLVTAKGRVPNLAHHSAVFYKKELFVFGGVQPSHSKVEKSCSNTLFIFNPEHKLWYKPIVEGEKPLPRFGHSASLLSHKLVIFGGRRTATYLNDIHVLDLGFMEYTAVKCGNMPPLPRGFHAALPVSDNRIVISGGCSAIGALQDVHVFNVDTSMWSSVVCPLLCLKARAGHSMINMGCSMVMGPEEEEEEEEERGGAGRIHCKVLVFGGSDCCGSFYNDTIKCKVDIPRDK